MNTAVGTGTYEYQQNQTLQGLIDKVDIDALKAAQSNQPPVVDPNTGQFNPDAYLPQLEADKEAENNQFLFYNTPSNNNPESINTDPDTLVNIDDLA